MICRNCNRNISNTDKVCPYCNAVQVILRDRNGNIIEPEKDVSGTEEESARPEAERKEGSDKTGQEESGQKQKPKRRVPGLPLAVCVVFVIAVWFAVKGIGGGESSPDPSLSAGSSQLESSVDSQEESESQGQNGEEEESQETAASETEDMKDEEPQKTDHWLSIEGTEPEYLLWDSDSRYLSSEEMKYDTAWELRLARNEIFARRGRIFQDEAIASYFSSKSWYRGTIAPDRFDYDKLNTFEKANVLLIQELEKTARTLIWLEHKGEWYGYDSFSTPLSGWVRNNGFYYYLEDDGHMVTGFRGDEPVREGRVLKGSGNFFLADGSLYYGTVYCRGSGAEGIVLYEDDLVSAGLEAFRGCERITFYEDGSYVGE